MPGVSRRILSCSPNRLAGTDQVWFYDMSADEARRLDAQANSAACSHEAGACARKSLLQRRRDAKNNLPIALPAGGTHSSEREQARTELGFCVPRRKSWPRL